MSRSEVESAGKEGATASPIAKVLNYFYLVVDPNEQSVGRWLSYEGMWEAWITAYFTTIIKPGDIVCDLGANYGYYTRLFETLSGPSGYVYSIEANPSLAGLIRESLEKYPIENGSQVEVLNIAALDRECTVQLNIPALLGWASVIGKPEESTPVEVQGFPLDDIIKKKVDVFKIDIEGAEPLAMAGMERLLRNCRCCVVEVGNYQPEEFLKSIFQKYDVSKINFLGKEESYDLDELHRENDFVMLVLRQRISRGLFKSLLQMIRKKTKKAFYRFFGELIKNLKNYG